MKYTFTAEEINYLMPTEIEAENQEEAKEIFLSMEEEGKISVVDTTIKFTHLSITN